MRFSVCFEWNGKEEIGHAIAVTIDKAYQCYDDETIFVSSFIVETISPDLPDFVEVSVSDCKRL